MRTMIVVLVLLVSGCSIFTTKEESFRVYYQRCEAACKQGQTDIQLEVSSLDLIYHCVCKPQAHLEQGI